MTDLTVIILTKNEEKNLGFALASIAPLQAKIFLVDSGSTDATLEIGARAGAEIVHHDFVTHAKQLNWALENLPITTGWVLRLDADERLTPELAAELPSRLPSVTADVSAFLMKRRVYFWGRWIRHGGYYPIWLLRLWRAGEAQSEDRDMDEHMVVRSGRIERLQHDIIDENHKGMSFWIEKHNRYADREIAAMMQAHDVRGPQAGSQVALKRMLKTRVYARLPRFWRAFLYWFFRYFVLFGFLDGKAGLVFHFLQGFWYRFLVDAKLEEREMKGIAPR